MRELIKINEVATKYKITKRTLRYYEEIGLITCIRNNSSNYRYYDDVALKKLEQIILLREVGFNLNEIKEILFTDNIEQINHIFQNKLLKMQDDINNLVYLKNVVSSIIKIRSEQSINKINLYEILKQQVYVNKKFERMIEMSQYIGDVIVLDIGLNLCTIGNELISSVKKLRIELEDKYNQEIPLVRIKDSSDLKPHEYRVLVKGVVIKTEGLENIDDRYTVERIIHTLKDALIDNIKIINL